MSDNKITIPEIKNKKAEGKKISMITAYDFVSGKIVDEAGVDIILVGDSLGMVVLGYKNTLRVTVDNIIYHMGAVRRAVKKALLIGDMPFLSFTIGIKDALLNAGRMMREGGAEAVKIEGGEEVCDVVEAMVKAKIPVMGHIGLTPQSIMQLGGFKIQGRENKEVEKLIKNAKALEQAGCFAIVIEVVPEEVGKKITESVNIPTIGIGAGKFCDGQVLVFHDVVGLYMGKTPKLAKKYVNGAEIFSDAVKKYIKEIEEGAFPSEENIYE